MTWPSSPKTALQIRFDLEARLRRARARQWLFAALGLLGPLSVPVSWVLHGGNGHVTGEWSVIPVALFFFGLAFWAHRAKRKAHEALRAWRSA